MKLYEMSADELRSKIDEAASKARSLHGRAGAIIARVEAEGRDLTTDEKRQVDSLLAQSEAASAELPELRFELRHAEAADERAASQASARPRVTTPTAPGGSAVWTPGHRGARFADVFRGRATPGTASRFASLGELALAVATGGHDARLIHNATMVETTGGSGGFLVPMQFLGPILDEALAREVVRPRATVVPIASNQATVGAFDYADGTNAARAGLSLTWTGEAAALSEQRGKTREVTLKPHKGSIFVRVSSELAADAIAFDAQLSEAMIAAVAAGLDAAFINGNGAGQPLGIVNAPATISVAKEASQVAATLVPQNLAKMAARLNPSSWSSSVWLIHPTALVQLLQLQTKVQNVAATENVGGYSPGWFTVAADGSMTLLTRPVVVTDACAPLGTVGDVILADLRRYLVGLRADAAIARDESRYFDSDEIAFRLILRIDGQPRDVEPTKLRDGSNTVSPFVTLATRS